MSHIIKELSKQKNFCVTLPIVISYVSNWAGEMDLESTVNSKSLCSKLEFAPHPP